MFLIILVNYSNYFIIQIDRINFSIVLSHTWEKLKRTITKSSNNNSYCTQSISFSTPIIIIIIIIITSNDKIIYYS